MTGPHPELDEFTRGLVAGLEGWIDPVTVERLPHGEATEKLQAKVHGLDKSLALILHTDFASEPESMREALVRNAQTQIEFIKESGSYPHAQ